MLPAIIASVLMALIVKRHQPPSASPKPVAQTPPPEEPPPAPPAPPEKPAETTKEPLFKNAVYRSRATAEYQAGLRKQHFNPKQDTREITIAKKFLDVYLRLPHVQHVEQFDIHSTTADDVVAYQKRYTTNAGNRLWQVCAIMTKYGHVYLSVMLNDYGLVSPDALGVLVSYDDSSLAHFIQGTKLKQMDRFGYVVFKEDEVIHDEAMLAFLLGDPTHPFSVSTYFHE